MSDAEVLDVVRKAAKRADDKRVNDVGDVEFDHRGDHFIVTMEDPTFGLRQYRIDITEITEINTEKVR
jgi:hypothetical protein